MPLRIERNDITRMRVDAIVNAANSSLLGGAGVDSAIHRAAGPGLLEECQSLGGCEVGQAKLTKAYRLPCHWVIHTVGPIWHGGERGEEALLASCYRKSLELAVEQDCQTVAFPLISTGAYGYPVDRAVRVATRTIAAFLEDHELTVYLVVYDRGAFDASRALFKRVCAFIDDVYVQDHTDAQWEQFRRNMPFGTSYSQEQSSPSARPGQTRPKLPGRDRRQSSGAPANGAPGSSGIVAPRRPKPVERDALSEGPANSTPASGAPFPFGHAAPKRPEPVETLEDGLFSGGLADSVPDDMDRDLERMLGEIDEGFSEMLLRMIDQRHMTDAECYKRANVDRRLFNKIKNNPRYRPSKPTVLAFVIALRLSLAEAREMLMKAGYALSRSSRTDIVVEYCICHGIYDILEINEVLFRLDLTPLGY